MPNCYWPLSFTLSPLGHSLSTILLKKFNENHMKPMHFTVRWFLSSELNEILWKKSWALRFQLLQEMSLAGPWICQSPPWPQKDPLLVNPTALRNFQSLITMILGWWSRRVQNWWVRGGNKKWRSRNIPKTWTLSLRRWMIPSKPTVPTNGLSRTMVWAGLYEGLWLCILFIYIWRITVLGETCSVTILCWQNGNQVNRTAVIAEFLTLWIEGRLQNEYICPMGLFFRGYRAGIFSSASAGYTQEGIFSSSKVFIFPLRIRYLSRNFVHLQRYSPSNSVIWILLFEHQPRPRGTSPWAH